MSWRRLFRRDKRDAEVQREMELHLELEIAEHVSRGMTEAEARRVTRVKFGNVQQVRETLWRQNSVGWAEKLLQDLHYVLRRLRRAPMAVATVVVSLGLGIAANVVLFSGVNKVMLQGPPVGDPASLMTVYSTNGHGAINSNLMPMPSFESMRRQLKSFSDVAGYTSYVHGTLSSQGEPQRVWGQCVTANFFNVAQTQMEMGRGFASSEEHAPVVVLSYEMWLRHFQGDAGVLGRAITLSGQTFTVIGVARPKFHGVMQLIDAGFWVPLSYQAVLENNLASIGEWVNVMARLRPGVSQAAGQAEMDTVAQRLSKEFPRERLGYNGLHIERTGRIPASEMGAVAGLLAAIVTVGLLVLCIAGSNVANLLLSRAMARHREMAVRTALGATRGQLIRPLLLESLLLSLGGGVFGTGISLLAMRALLVFHLPFDVPADLTLSLDWRVLLYAFLLSVGTGLLCGIGPAFAATRPAVPNALKGESTLERPGRKWTMRNVLVVVQISLCMVLLCTTGLYLHGLAKMTDVDPGFRTSGVRVLSIDPLHNGYKAEQVGPLLKRLRDSVAATPGVISAAWTDATPLGTDTRAWNFRVTGSQEHPSRDPSGYVFNVDRGFFDTMGIARVAGRDFDDAGADAPKQMVVNEAFARSLFPGKSAVGEHVSIDGHPDLRESYEIVGVVKNIKATEISEPDKPAAYESLGQNAAQLRPFLGYSLLVHYEGNGAEMANTLRNDVHAIDPSLSVYSEKEMTEQVRDSMLLPRVESVMFGAFGLLGLLLAAVGLYGVMSYSVQRRTQEIGVRLALGATRGGVQGLIVGQGMRLAAVALLIGLPLALGASKIAARMQYGIAAYDPVSFTWMPIFLACVALVACWVPALRAARVDPQVALRHE